jgi:hypothetical protein
MPQVGFNLTIPMFERAKQIMPRPRGHCDRRLQGITLRYIRSPISMDWWLLSIKTKLLNKPNTAADM